MAAHFLEIDMSTLNTVLLILYAVVVTATIVVIIHDRRDPVKALAWIMVVTLLPFIGLLIYVLFGRNHRKEKTFHRKAVEDLRQLKVMCGEQIRELNDPDVQHMDSIESNKNIITLLLNNNKSVLTVGNKVKILNNGKEKFKELFEAVQNATESIHMEYYIFEPDRTGRRLLALLKEKAAQGVEVRIIYDDMGSWGMKRRHVKRMRRDGIKVHCFLPLRFPWFTSSVNNRNHRKIVVIDGKVGFTGGINVAERYLKGIKIGPWRDTHLRIEGNAVNMLQAIFVTDWYFVNKKQLLNDTKYFPQTKIRTKSPIQIVSSGPDSDWASIMQAYFAAINKARKSIYISTPYFMPNQSILTALKVASLSGVDVRIILPFRSDSTIVYWASRSYVSELLDAGIKVYFYCKGFNHSKFIIIDSNFCSIGSANMDYRSFEDNFEVTAVMYDPRIAEELAGYFMKDLEDSTLITAEGWDNRSSLHAVWEALARLLSPLL